MASTVHQSYDLPAGATLTVEWSADRPATAAELDLLARIATTVERSAVVRAGER
jgi:hypothetical protein